MNGIGLLVLIASAGQIGATQPTLSRDFGWEIDQRNPDKALCYIVQISPEIAATMERDAYENTSNMPPELVGRATRIVVRIGNSLLPQEPSLEVLRTMPVVNSPPDAIAQLGNSRMSDVEGKDVVPVQQDRTGAPLGCPHFQLTKALRAVPSRRVLTSAASLHKGLRNSATQPNPWSAAPLQVSPTPMEVRPEALRQ